MVKPDNNALLQFVPTDALKQLLTRSKVSKILEGLKKRPRIDIPSLESFICDNASAVFATLVMIEKEPLIEQFYQHGFSDKQLPFDYKIAGNCVEATSSQLGTISPDRHPFNNPQWRAKVIEDFWDRQWYFLSPVFSQSQFRYHFDKGIRMPFLKEYPLNQKTSNFSVVEERPIHRDHVRNLKSVVR